MMGTTPYAQWLIVALMLSANIAVSRRLWRSLSHSGRSARREGAVRLFAVLIFLLQAIALLLFAIGNHNALEVAGYTFGGVVITYLGGLVAAWIIDGFTGRAKRLPPQ
jgi:hypothetical protein